MNIRLFHIITILLALSLAAACSGKPDYPVLPKVSGDKIMIETSSLKEGRPRFFTYAYESGKVDYFAVLIDGTVKSYFDACIKCSASKKGFRFRQGRLQCKACGESYGTDQLQGTGSCHPIPLKGTSEGKHFVISITDMMEGSRYF